MKEKFVLFDLHDQEYYCEDGSFDDDIHEALFFDSMIEAVKRIDSDFKNKFITILPVYI